MFLEIVSRLRRAYGNWKRQLLEAVVIAAIALVFFLLLWLIGKAAGWSLLLELTLAAFGGASGTLLILYGLRQKWDAWGRDLDSIISGRDRVEMLPSPRLELARSRAAQRRRNIEIAMTEQEANFPWLSGAMSRPMRRVFSEAPPTFEAPEVRYIDDDLGERFGQMVRLDWQFGFDQFLLAERVVDAILLIRQRSRLQGVAPVIGVSGHDKALERQGLFPWKVILETDHPHLYERELRAISDWLGIGIDVAPARRLRHMGKCHMGGMFEGVVGGNLEVGGKKYAMACSHVISSDCPGVAFRGRPAVDSNQPDAVLLAPDEAKCFGVVSPSAQCRPATPEIVERCILKRTLVHKRQPHMTRKKGIISSRVIAFPLGAVYYRFPHLQAVPLQIRLLGPFKSVLQRAFSVEGHSGSWVFEESTGHWLGMIVAGDEDRKLCYVAEAQPLLNYFASCLGIQSTELHPSSFLSQVIRT